MPENHDKGTIVSMAIVAMGLAVLLHEGLGHGVTAWLRGDIPTEMSSNHLSAMVPDKWVDAAGTLVNLAVGLLAWFGSRAAGRRANLRYFLWLLAAKNLLPGAGYFLFSGVTDFGDWAQVLVGWPHHAAWRVGMIVFGVVLYWLAAWLLAVGVRPFARQRGEYNAVGRLAYLAGCLFSCAAGLLDPLGMALYFKSTVPAAFGGSSGMLWLDSMMPKQAPPEPLRVQRSMAWWIAAAVFGLAYILAVGPGIKLGH